MWHEIHLLQYYKTLIFVQLPDIISRSSVRIFNVNIIFGLFHNKNSSVSTVITFIFKFVNVPKLFRIEYHPDPWFRLFDYKHKNVLQTVGTYSWKNERLPIRNKFNLHMNRLKYLLSFYNTCSILNKDT
jgi:hypothetical protein